MTKINYIGGSAFDAKGEWGGVGVKCPVCDRELYHLLKSTEFRDASTEPGLCFRCHYRGFKHGGFTDAVNEWIAAAFREGSIDILE